jgi:outer membrane protein TolC
MKRLTLLLFTISSLCFAQKTTLSLDSCVQMAKRNFPLIKQNNLIEQSAKNAMSVDNKNWLPKLAFTSRANYQSEVIQFGLQSFPHDSYLSALSLEQTLFDAGQMKQQKILDKLNGDNELLKNEIELYKLIDRVNQIYSSILVTRENVKTLNIYKDDIGNRKTILAAAVKNGLSLQSNLDELEAEELKAEQSIAEATDNVNALYESLGLFINKPVDANTEFTNEPLLSNTKNDEINRPELKLFDSQKAMLEVRHKLVVKNTLPKISLNGEGDYGRPGPNFLNQNLRFFAQASINLKWNIGGVYNLSNENQSFNLNKQMVDVQKEVFEFNLKNSLLSQNAQIMSLKKMIEKDKLIIEKRHNIKETAATQLANGAITTSDYLTQLNAEMQAVLNQKVHEIKLMNAITSYNATKGINNF